MMYCLMHFLKFMIYSKKLKNASKLRSAIKNCNQNIWYRNYNVSCGFVKTLFISLFVFEAFKILQQHVYESHEKDPFALELVTYESYSFVNTYLLCLERGSFFQRMFLSFIIAFFPIKLFVWVKATNHFMHNCDVNKSFLFMSYTPTFYKISISTLKIIF